MDPRSSTSARPRTCCFADGNERREWPVPSTLVILDGTWRQARRMRIRVAAGMPVLTLPPDGQSALRMRVRRVPEAMSTIEAIAGALDRLGDPEPAQALRDVSDRMNALWMQLRCRV
jgi:DTW domain-containing protein YfiP